jgi:hypothetical protein
VHAGGGRPLDGADEAADRRRELAVEHLDREDLDVRRQVLDRGDDRRPVPEAIEIVVVLTAVGVEADAAGDAVDVGCAACRRCR